MDITLTLKCNNYCVFCPRKDFLKAIVCRSQKEIYSDIEKIRRKTDNIALSGGEVTLMSNLPEIISFCKEKGFKEIGIITNGRALKNKRLARDLIQYGVRDFAVSVYSFNNRIHDRITGRSGSGSDTKKGLLNLIQLSRQYPVSIRVNIVLNYWNHQDIHRTLEALYACGVRNFIVAEQVIMDKDSKHLSLNEIKKDLEQIRNIPLRDTRLVLRGFPICLLKGKKVLVPEGFVLKESDPLVILEKHEVDTLIKEKSRKSRYLRKFSRLFTRIKPCESCEYAQICMGIQKAYF
ncbi:MAG: radical SAM protein [Spirochaetes bacterium]|nr:radical SAM protein [Spirochaetota bacterium]